MGPSIPGDEEGKMKSSYMRRDHAKGKRARMIDVLRKQPELETEAMCQRFGCCSTMVEGVRREVKGKR